MHFKKSSYLAAIPSLKNNYNNNCIHKAYTQNKLFCINFIALCFITLLVLKITELCK